jgi:hypothetical protein
LLRGVWPRDHLLALAGIDCVDPVYDRAVAARGTLADAGVATTAINWLNDLHPTGYRAYEYGRLVAITVLAGAIGIRTLIAVGRWQLLPASACPAVPAVPDPQGSLVERLAHTG